MYYNVVSVKYLEGYKLEVIFSDGKRGIANLEKYKNYGGIFNRFNDLEYFKEVYINKELGVLSWPDDLDIAPETLYHEVTGEPLPEWMNEER
ncbi:MAG: DUF2442 domain-containing protein [Bacteroidetes bacterium]|nr:DUF2442 domain-containing protein [Bacteroidota bacterium]MBU2586276.1 DUF2442 domain-containing protein [Bacteroidota bacterium]